MEKLHLPALSVVRTFRTQEQAVYIGAKVQGTFNKGSKPARTMSTSCQNSSCASQDFCTFLHSVRCAPSLLKNRQRVLSIAAGLAVDVSTATGHYRC